MNDQDFANHDHSACTLVRIADDEGHAIVASLPADACGWEGHSGALEEAGYCPVCQH